MDKIRILIADSHFLIRAGLKSLLSAEREFEVVGEAICADHVWPLLEKHRPEVLIIDYAQPGKFSLETLAEVQARYPETGLLIISANDDRQGMFQALEYQVQSYLTKECDRREILDAVRATARGEKFFCSNVVNFLVEKTLGLRGDCSPSPLTPREVEIVRLVAGGKVAKEIADLLSLSTHTVYTHRKNIMKKLNLSTHSELVVYAVRKGWVSPLA